MEQQNPTGAKHLYALLGDKIQDFPPDFVERVERKLEALENSQALADRSVTLRLIPDVADDAPLLGVGSHADLRRHSKVAVPMRTLQGLAAILEVLHSVHLAKQDGDPEGVLSEHIVEGLIVSGRALVRASTDSMWGPP